MNFPVLTYQANYREDQFNAQGGILMINDTTILFKPHSVNFGDLSEKYVNIADIGGYSKGALTNLSLWTKDGYEIRLVVWKKDEVIKEVESRRRALFASIGQTAPPLRYGNCMF